MRVVVDTNVIVSGLISSRGAPARIVDAILDQQVIPVFSKETFSELLAVLQRRKFNRYFAAAGLSIQSFSANLSAVAEFVEVRPVRAAIRDPKDRPMLEVAGSAPPPDFIVTGDKDFVEHQYGGVLVLSPAAFCRVALPPNK